MTTPPPALGLSIGSAYSCVAVAQGARVDIVSNAGGSRTTPSYVSFAQGETTAGEAAKGKALRFPNVTIHSLIRLVGRPFADVAAQRWPFQVVEGPDGEVAIELPGPTEDDPPVVKSAADVLTALIEDLKSTADDFAGVSIQDAVVAVPMDFTDHQRECITAATRKAGLQVLRLIRNPIAVALAYGLDQPRPALEHALVFDCGATQSTATVLRLSPDGLVSVAASLTESVGGDDFDKHLVTHFQTEFYRKTRLDISDSKKSRLRLCNACEAAKRILSASPSANCEVDSLFEGVDFASNITRVRFEQSSSAVFQSLVALIDRALAAAQLSRDAVARVLLAGGSCRIPKLQAAVLDLFPACAAVNNAELQTINRTAATDEVIAAGAALQASLQKQGPPSAWHIHPEVELPLTPSALGVVVGDGRVHTLIAAGTSLPCERQQTFAVPAERSVYLQIATAAADGTLLETVGEVELSDITGDRVDCSVVITERGSVKVELRDPAAPANHAIAVLE